MNVSDSPEKREVLKLGPPLSGEVIIAVDSTSAGTTFAAGTHTLLPGAEFPVHRHLDREKALFVHKGQGRATVNERSVVVVPGTMLYVPRGVWHGLRNTGTGALQVAWVSSPGLEDFFRDLSRVGASPSEQVLQELAQRHSMEFRQTAEAPASPHHRRRRRGGGRRRRDGGGPSHAATAPNQGVSGSPTSPHASPMSPVDALSPKASPPLSAGPAMSPASSMTPGKPATSGAPHGRRRHRHRRRSGGGQRSTPPATSQGQREGRLSAPSASTSTSAPGSLRPSADRSRSSRRHRSRRVKEVYMGGRWIRVEGEGPVIAPGSQRSGERIPKPGEEDEPPSSPLSVAL